MDVCSVRSSDAAPVRAASRCRPGVCPLSREDAKALRENRKGTTGDVADEYTPSPQPLQLLQSENTVTNPGPGFDMVFIGPPGGTPATTTVNGPWGLGF